MLARIQQLLVVGALLLTAGWWLTCMWFGWPIAAHLGVAAALAAYAAVLGVEFALLSRVSMTDSAPHPTWRQLLTAWWGEVRWAPNVFVWRQPFRSQRWPDQLPVRPSGRRGLLLVHGFVCNRGLWNRWLQRLGGLDVPFLAVSLEPVFGSIDHYSASIATAVERLRQHTGLAPVIVAHSMGGLAVRRWWADESNSRCVHRLITIGTPHHGTWLARFAFSQNGRQMRLKSDWLKKLARDEPPNMAARCTCFYSNCDNIVFPPSAATLTGADNRHLSGVAHVHMADHDAPWQEALYWLSTDVPTAAAAQAFAPQSIDV
jgi:triacylglycerol lipase